MRLPVLLAALLSLTACMFGGGRDGSARSAEETQRATHEVVEDAIPVTVEALGADEVDLHAEWLECMTQLSWKYSGTGAVIAPGDDVQTKLREVEASLVKAGFTKSLTTRNQVSVERDGISFTVRRPPESHHRLWSVSFGSGCGGYSEEDQQVIDQDPGSDFDDLGR